MRKLIAVLVLSLASVGASADPYRHHGHGGHYGGHHGGYRNDWIAPLIVGGVVTYALTRPQPPVIVQQQPQPVYQAPVGYHYENILDANCNCYRLVLVQN